MGFLTKINEKADFANGIETLKPSTKRGIENTKKQFEAFCLEEGSSLEEAIEEMKITKNKNDIFKALQSWVNWLNRNGISESSIPIYFSHIRAFLYYHGISITDQERKREIKYPKILEDEKHGLTVDEIKQIMNVTFPKRKALYMMLLSSGLRIGEAVQLRKKDLKLVGQNFLINVKGEYTKTGKGRKCFMSKEATRMVLPLWKRTNGIIFGTNEDREKSCIAEHVRFNAYREKAGLLEKYGHSSHFHISLHSFRAYFITKISRHDPNLAKRLAGQKSYLEQYDRLSIEERLVIYKKAEPNLFIYEQMPKSEEILELHKEIQKGKEENVKLEEKYTKFEDEAKGTLVKMLEELKQHKEKMEKELEWIRKQKPITKKTLS